MILTCSSCHNECSYKIVNTGIGHYEYWGAPGYDDNPAVISDCCSEPCLNDDGTEVSAIEIKIHEDNEYADHMEHFYED